MVDTHALRPERIECGIHGNTSRVVGIRILRRTLISTSERSIGALDSSSVRSRRVVGRPPGDAAPRIQLCRLRPSMSPPKMQKAKISK